MKNKKIIIALILMVGTTLVVFGFSKKLPFTFSQTNTIPQQAILGEWHLQQSPSDKIVFLENGEVKMYENNNLLYTDTYTLTNSCDGQQAQNGGLFLKITDGQDGTISCNEINGINESNSSILSFTDENGRLVVYVR